MQLRVNADTFDLPQEQILQCVFVCYYLSKKEEFSKYHKFYYILVHFQHCCAMC